MIDPTTFGASLIETPDLELTHVRDIEEYEGPLLSEFRSKSGDTFLYHWADCDRGAGVTRWVVVRTPRQDLNQYLVRAITLRDVILRCHDQFVYLFDTDADEHVCASYFVRTAQLATDYVPGADSYYSARFGVAVAARHQDVFVNADWGYEDVSGYPRKYLQTYAFHAIFGRAGDATGLAAIRYRLTKGWIFHSLFNTLREYIPAPLRASLAEVAVASPGYIRFDVNPAVAESVREAVASFTANQEEIAGVARVLRRWSNGREPMSDARVRNSIIGICERMELNTEALLSRSRSRKYAVKALMSYLGKVAFLAKRDTEGTAMLVGLRRPVEEDPDQEPEDADNAPD